jgi:hypothetical protein
MPEPAAETIRCRPNAVEGFFVVLLGVFGFGCFGLPFLSDQPRDPLVWIASAVFALMILAPTAFLGAFAILSEIQATATEFRWRSFGRWNSVPWSDVTDYFERRREKGARAWIVETRRGACTFGPSSWANAEKLRDAIRERSGAPIAEWALEGTRAEEPPREFGYRKGEAWFFAALALLCTGMVGWLVVTFALKTPGIIRDLGWAMGAGIVALALITMGAIPALMMALVFGHTLPEYGRRKAERILVGPSGFEVQRSGQAWGGSWGDVVRFRAEPLHWVSRRHVLETKRGQWDFTPDIAEYRRLIALLERYVPEAVQDKTSEREDDLTAEGGRWTSGVPGVGRRLFHYRTRTNRALLAMVALPALTSLLRLWLESAALLPPAAGADNWVMLGVGGVFLSWAVWRFQAGGIEVDDEGLTERLPFGVRRVRWTEIRAYWKVGADLARFRHVEGLRGNVRFWMGISGLPELEAEISRRAVNSVTSSWEDGRPPSLIPSPASALKDDRS